MNILFLLHKQPSVNEAWNGLETFYNNLAFQEQTQTECIKAIK